MPYFFNPELTLAHHIKTINPVAFHPQGHLLATGGDDSLIILWDCETGVLVHEIDTRMHSRVTQLLWIPPQQLIEASFIFLDVQMGPFTSISLRTLSASSGPYPLYKCTVAQSYRG
ncbi:hypothetical protein M422DRAFT_52164 [Sphaerobolus stellatus SS14]|uniref:Coronin n=1 Tax=Sphaerobolus stellatus (strain SS14) TaxID=990650 RepID=A0A0C9UGW4_SPHS4|nr:hypothetical protein M422DRAFT_52164 [Sphaerobolus stellatus SS14]